LDRQTDIARQKYTDKQTYTVHTHVIRQHDAKVHSETPDTNDGS